MKMTNMIFRFITLALQTIALAMFFLPPLFNGGRVGIGWLILGVLHAAVFCVIFYRNERKRTVLSIILTVFMIFWSLFILGLGLLIISGFMSVSIFSPFIVYSLLSMLAVIFALAGPRRYVAKGNDEGRMI